MAGIDDILSNNLILQYMSGIGSAISEGKSPASAMNAVTQQQLGTKSKVKMQNNYLKMLGQALGSGEGNKFSMGSDGSVKLTIDPAVVGDESDTIGNAVSLLGGQKYADSIKEESLPPISDATEKPLSTPMTVGRATKSSEGGFVMNDGRRATDADRQMIANLQLGIEPNQGIDNNQLPQLSPDDQQKFSSIQSMVSALGGEQPIVNQSATAQPSRANKYNILAQQLLNPQYSPLDVNGADLAGLSSADVSQALHDSMGIESHRTNAIANAAQMLAAGDKYSIEKSGTIPYPIQVPGMGVMTADQFKELPSEVKEYASYAHMQKQNNPNAPIVSYEEFKKFGKETRSQFYEYAIEHPEVWQKVLEEKKAGATSLNLGPLNTAIEHGKGVNVAEVLAPDYVEKVKKNFLRDPEYNDPAIPKGLPPEQVDKFVSDNKRQKLIKAMDEGISQAYRAIGKKIITGKDTKTGKIGWFTEDGTLVREFPK